MLDNQIDRLAQLLKNAADAHHTYEQSTDKPDPDWPKWYAAYLTAHDVAVIDYTDRRAIEDRATLMDRIYAEDRHHA